MVSIRRDTHRKPWTDFVRVVIKGDKYTVARRLADAGIPFAFVAEAGPNTVGDVHTSHYAALGELLAANTQMEGRDARWPWTDRPTDTDEFVLNDRDGALD